MKWRVLGLFLVLGLLVYLPALGGPFQFDDKRVVLDAKVRENPRAWSYGGVWGTRGLAHASFWVDWRLWGEKTAPYHIENLLIHVFASWLVFILLQQLLQESVKAEKHKSIILAIFGGLIFLLHPAQTQAVAYISQRFESMSAMFYLLSVVLYLRARIPTRSDPVGLQGQTLMYAAAWLAGMASASSKEIAITLPVMLMVLEVLVVKRSDLLTFSLRQSLILALFLLIPVKIAAQVVMSADLGGQAPTVTQIVEQAKVVEQQDLAMTRWTYLLTQFNVVRTYVRLLAVPVGQSIDYDYPLQTGWDAKTVVSLGGIVGLLGIAIYSLIARPTRPGLVGLRGQALMGLGIWWFFITLAPTSSVIPIRDVIYEHRLYLAMVGWVMVLVVVGGKFYNRYKNYKNYILASGVSLLVIYSGLTLARNRVWASEVKLWEDAWKRGPNKDRTNKNYGFVLTQERRFSEGIARLERAVELKPDDQDYRITLGAAYLQVQEWESARQQFDKATQLRPDKADGWNNLGVALFQLKRYEESKQMFAQALELDDRFYMAWLGLGGTEIVLGNLEAAQAALNRAVEIDPKAPEAYRNLAILERIRSSRE